MRSGGGIGGAGEHTFSMFKSARSRVLCRAVFAAGMSPGTIMHSDRGTQGVFNRSSQQCVVVQIIAVLRILSRGAPIKASRGESPRPLWRGRWTSTAQREVRSIIVATAERFSPMFKSPSQGLTNSRSATSFRRFGQPRYRQCHEPT